jgi:hypothetical protein
MVDNSGCSSGVRHQRRSMVSAGPCENQRGVRRYRGAPPIPVRGALSLWSPARPTSPATGFRAPGPCSARARISSAAIPARTGATSGRSNEDSRCHPLRNVLKLAEVLEVADPGQSHPRSSRRELVPRRRGFPALLLLAQSESPTIAPGAAPRCVVLRKWLFTLPRGIAPRRAVLARTGCAARVADGHEATYAGMARIVVISRSNTAHRGATRARPATPPEAVVRNGSLVRTCRSVPSTDSGRIGRFTELRLPHEYAADLWTAGRRARCERASRVRRVNCIRLTFGPLCTMCRAVGSALRCASSNYGTLAGFVWNHGGQDGQEPRRVCGDGVRGRQHRGHRAAPGRTSLSVG